MTQRQKYEYKSTSLDSESDDELNKLGTEGWQLVSAASVPTWDRHSGETGFAPYGYFMREDLATPGPDAITFDEMRKRVDRYAPLTTDIPYIAQGATPDVLILNGRHFSLGQLEAIVDYLKHSEASDDEPSS